MNAVVDERTLREIYLTAFEIVVKEGKAKALMTSYNQINGAMPTRNEHLLKEDFGAKSGNMRGWW